MSTRQISALRVGLVVAALCGAFATLFALIALGIDRWMEVKQTSSSSSSTSSQTESTKVGATSGLYSLCYLGGMCEHSTSIAHSRLQDPSCDNSGNNTDVPALTVASIVLLAVGSLFGLLGGMCALYAAGYGAESMQERESRLADQDGDDNAHHVEKNNMESSAAAASAAAVAVQIPNNNKNKTSSGEDSPARKLRWKRRIGDLQQENQFGCTCSSVSSLWCCGSGSDDDDDVIVDENLDTSTAAASIARRRQNNNKKRNGKKNSSSSCDTVFWVVPLLFVATLCFGATMLLWRILESSVLNCAWDRSICDTVAHRLWNVSAASTNNNNNNVLTMRCGNGASFYLVATATALTFAGGAVLALMRFGCACGSREEDRHVEHHHQHHPSSHLPGESVAVGNKYHHLHRPPPPLHCPRRASTKKDNTGSTDQILDQHQHVFTPRAGGHEAEDEHPHKKAVETTQASRNNSSQQQQSSATRRQSPSPRAPLTMATSRELLLADHFALQENCLLRHATLLGTIVVTARLFETERRHRENVASVERELRAEWIPGRKSSLPPPNPSKNNNNNKSTTPTNSNNMNRHPVALPLKHWSNPQQQRQMFASGGGERFAKERPPLQVLDVKGDVTKLVAHFFPHQQRSMDPRTASAITREIQDVGSPQVNALLDRHKKPSARPAQEGQQQQQVSPSRIPAFTKVSTASGAASKNNNNNNNKTKPQIQLLNAAGLSAEQSGVGSPEWMGTPRMPNANPRGLPRGGVNNSNQDLPAMVVTNGGDGDGGGGGGGMKRKPTPSTNNNLLEPDEITASSITHASTQNQQQYQQNNENVLKSAVVVDDDLPPLAAAAAAATDKRQKKAKVVKVAATLSQTGQSGDVSSDDNSHEHGDSTLTDTSDLTLSMQPTSAVLDDLVDVASGEGGGGGQSPQQLSQARGGKRQKKAMPQLLSLKPPPPPAAAASSPLSSSSSTSPSPPSSGARGRFANVASRSPERNWSDLHSQKVEQLLQNFHNVGSSSSGAATAAAAAAVSSSRFARSTSTTSSSAHQPEKPRSLSPPSSRQLQQQQQNAMHKQNPALTASLSGGFASPSEKDTTALARSSSAPLAKQQQDHPTLEKFRSDSAQLVARATNNKLPQQQHHATSLEQAPPPPPPRGSSDSSTQPPSPNVKSAAGSSLVVTPDRMEHLPVSRTPAERKKMVDDFFAPLNNSSGHGRGQQQHQQQQHNPLKEVQLHLDPQPISPFRETPPGKRATNTPPIVGRGGAGSGDIFGGAAGGELVPSSSSARRNAAGHPRRLPPPTPPQQAVEHDDIQHQHQQHARSVSAAGTTTAVSVAVASSNNNDNRGTRKRAHSFQDYWGSDSVKKRLMMTSSGGGQQQGRHGVTVPTKTLKPKEQTTQQRQETTPGSTTTTPQKEQQNRLEALSAVLDALSPVTAAGTTPNK